MKHEAEGEGQGGKASEGEPVIGEKTVWWALEGLLIGGAAGWLAGLSFGYGRLNIPGLAPVAAGGAGVAGFVFASFFGSLLGLAGALLGTASEARSSAKRHEGMKHGRPSLIERLPVYGSVVLALFMAFTLFVIVSRGYGAGSPSDQGNRVTWNQKNAARVGGATDAETAQHVLQIAYPATRAENSPKAIVTVADDWRAALAATPLIARPTSAALIIAGTGGTAEAGAGREVERLRATTVKAQAVAPSPSSSAADTAAVPQASPGPTTTRPCPRRPRKLPTPPGRP